jgi:anti-sigma factor RsiW
MKSCSHQSLTLLVAGVLEDSEAEAIRAHLAICPDCRAEHARLEGLCHQLTEPTRKIPALRTPSHFHERLMGRIRSEDQGTERSDFATVVRAWLTRPGVVGATCACIFVLFLAWRFGPRNSPAPSVTADVTPPRSVVANESLELAEASTGWAYQQAFIESFEALEQLLEKNAQHDTSSGMTLFGANASEGL